MRLEVTRSTDLASRMLLALGTADTRMKANELARHLGTTTAFVRRIAMPLVARGWVESEPGPSGGYRGAVPLCRISVLDVVEAIEGPVDMDRCVLDHRGCDRANPCPLHAGWAAAREQLLRTLRQTPMSTLTERPLPTDED